MLSQIFLLSPRGFCAGVKRAIDIVEKALQKFGGHLYAYHPIVHNEYVVSALEKKGVIFVENLDEIPEGNIVIFSAHGVSPEVREKAKKRNLKIFDATCPLVTKVHMEAVEYHKKGYTIFLIGHKNHQEIIGTMGEAPMMLIENMDDIQKLDIRYPQKIACLTQTTLSLDDTKEIIQALTLKFPDLTFPSKKDICYATQNRQNAIKEIAGKVDFILVIGSKKSSNSNRLVETAEKCGVQSQLISHAEDLDFLAFEGMQSIAITAGASVPEILIEEIVVYLQKKYPNVKIENYVSAEENISFTLPKELL